MVPAQVQYSIMHTSGERNCGRDLLSMWLIVAAMKARAVVAFAPFEPDDTMPLKELVRQVQQSTPQKDRTRAHGAADFMAPDGQAVKETGLSSSSWWDVTSCGYLTMRTSCNNASWYALTCEEPFIGVPWRLCSGYKTTAARYASKVWWKSLSNSTFAVWMRELARWFQGRFEEQRMVHGQAKYLV